MIRWLKLGFYFLAAVTVAGILTLAVVLLTFDDDDYRQWLTQSIFRITGHHLIIGGSFSASVSTTPRLSATHVRIVSAKGDLRLQAKKIEFQVALRPLLRKSLVIKNLVIDESEIKLNLQRLFRKTADQLPFIVLFEHAEIHDTNFYVQLHDDTEIKLQLDVLVINEPMPREPLSVTATGFINEKAFSINGKLGSLRQIYQSQQPYPVEIVIQTTHSRISIDGAIDEPLIGRGLDLTVKSKTSDIKTLIKALEIDAPLSGGLTVNAALSGNYNAPMASNLDLELIRHGKHSLYAKGSIDNILSGENTDLQFNGMANDAKLIRWLLPYGLPRCEKLTFQGQILKTGNRYWVRNIAAHLVTPDGLEILASGETGISRPLADFPFHRLNLGLSFSAPTSAAAKSFLFDKAPELGPVNGTARLISKKDAFGLNDIDISLGNTERNSLTMTGRIGEISIEPRVPNADVNFDLLLHLDSSQALSSMVDSPFPELGPVTVSGHFRGSEHESVISGLSFTTESPKQLHIQSDGALFLNDINADDLQPRMHLNFQVSGATNQALAALNDLTQGNIPDDHSGTRETPSLQSGHSPHKDLGQISMSGILTNLDGSVGVENLNLTIKKENDFEFIASGIIGDLVNYKELEFDYSFQAKNPTSFGDRVGIEIPDVGAIDQTGRVNSKGSAINLIGAATVGETRFSQEMTLNIDGERPYLKGTLLIPALHRQTINSVLSAREAVSVGAERLETKTEPEIFSRMPLPLAMLEKIDLDLSVFSNKFTGTGLNINEIYTKLSLARGNLHVRAEISGFEGGKATFDLIGSPPPRPRFKLSASGHKVDIKNTLLVLIDNDNAEGNADFVIELTGAGRSVYDIASTLDGQIGIVVESGRIVNRNLNLLVLDFIGWLFSYAENKKSTEIDCAIMQFEFENGTGDSQTMFVNTPSLNAIGTAKLNLGEEKIDMLVSVKPIDRLLATTVPIQIRGDLGDPDVNVIPRNKAIATYGKLLFSPIDYLRSKASKTLKIITGNRPKRDGACRLADYSKQARQN